MPRICASSNCTKRSSYGKVRGKVELCAEHAEEGMVDVRSKNRCGRSGCMTQPSYGKVGGKPEVCAEHADEGMVNVVSKRCGRSGCMTRPSYGKAGGKPEVCAEHAEEGMVNVRSNRCGRSGCMTQPSYGKVGGKAELCAEHAEEDMVNVREKRCGRSGCMTQPSYGKVGGMAELCAEHADEGMVNVVSKRCGHTGCRERPSHGKVGGKAVVCAPHAQENMVDLTSCSHSSGGDIAGVGHEGPGSTESSGSTAVGHLGAGNKRRGSRSVHPQTGIPSGGGTRRTSKLARVHFVALVAATSAEAAGGDDGPNPSQDGCHSEPDEAAVKTEVGVSCKVAPKTKCSADSTAVERATPAEYGLGSEPDASVKAEVLVSLPSKRRAA